jgi:exosortase A-associated hydrolase 1
MNAIDAVHAVTASGHERPGYSETPVWIECDGERMFGMFATPTRRPCSGLGVLILVGGPQYRVGSHRQFVQLARALAGAGHVSLRLDYRGMGDSEGRMRSFEEVRDDIVAGLNFLCVQPGVHGAILWGLCDAASSALMFGSSDPRIAAMALANPWVRTEATYATTQLKHYYWQRLLEREFWGKLLRGHFDWIAATKDFVRKLRTAARGSSAVEPQSFQQRMAEGLRRFRGPVLLLLSGRDLTAKEFVELSSSDPEWSSLLARPNLQRAELADADHTFSSGEWNLWMQDRTIAWMAGLVGSATATSGNSSAGRK